MANDGSSVSPYQRCCCPDTMPDVDIVPAKMNTPTNDRLIATSYEIICALERSPPRSG